MTRFKPFKDTTHNPVEKWGDSWGWFIYPPVGEERWSGDYPTRQAAREARKGAMQGSKGSGAFAEWNFWRR